LSCPLGPIRVSNWIRIAHFPRPAASLIGRRGGAILACGLHSVRRSRRSVPPSFNTAAPDA
jgi:hypothetical protein